MRTSLITNRRNLLIAALFTTVMMLSGLTPALADEASPVSIKTEAFVEKIVIDKQGQKKIERVPATEVLPGGVVILVNTVTNIADKQAEGVVVGNPIPENMTYIKGSASAKNAALTFSVDNGQSFDIPGKLLVIQADGKPRQAVAADYTHIRWQLLSPLPSQGTQLVEFQAKVK